MKLSVFCKDYPLLDELVKREGDFELFPPQEEALNSGFLDGKNLVLASPTSSGKTLIAKLAMLVNKPKGKCVYLVPLRSLGFEKLREFRKSFDGLLSVALSVGDLTRSDERLGRSDVIICSYEKFDSLLRHKASWINDVTLVVADEVHLIDDVARGPVLEVLLTRLRLMKSWVIALSATVGNSSEVASWLNALLVSSDFRPVKLIEGLMVNESVSFKNDDKTYSVPSITDLCRKVISEGRQCLVFVNNRRSAEFTAERLGKELRISNPELNIFSRRVLRQLSSPTRQCRRLSDCVINGVAFNHAGLVNSQKELIEDAFRQGLVKVIVCTTVLAYGVSLPAYMVIIKDFKRFSSEGMSPISSSEYLQIAGRAGRSGYDSLGESVLVVNGDVERELAWNEYLCSKPQAISSKLGVEPVLRFHALSLVCTGSCSSINELVDFFKASFFGFSYGSESFLKSRIDNVVSELIDWGFIKAVNSRLIPERVGLRVNELYIDPLSAHNIIDKLNNFLLKPLAFLHLACSCNEVPCLSLRKNDFPFILEELAVNEADLMSSPPSAFSYEYEGFLRSFKTSLLINDWISERSEDWIMEEYGTAPGILHQLLRNLEWVLFAIGQIALIKGFSGVKEFIDGLILRVKYGVKSDLLMLVNIKGVGRARARKLYANGLRSVDEVRKASPFLLSKLLGPNTSVKVINFLNKEFND